MILITGATGTLGSHLLFKLLQKYDKVVALHRQTSNLQNVKRIFSYYTDTPEKYFNRIIWRKADITDKVALYEAFEYIDVVYHCAAYINLSLKNLEKSMLINVQGTANIVDIALQRKIKKLCHVSSIAAIGLNSKGLTTEDDLLNPEETKSPYSLSKYYGELEVWRGINEGLNAVIVNPSIIVAPYIIGTKIQKLLKYISKRGVKHYVCGKKGYIDVNDLAKVMIMLTESNISAERFIISAENLSFRQIIDYVNRFYGKDFSKKKIPIGFFKFLSAFFSITPKPLINRQIIHYLYNDEMYSNEKLKSFIDFNFSKIEQSIYDVLEIYGKQYKI